MNIGTEAVLGTTTTVDVTAEEAYEAALELIESVVVMEESDVELASMFDFLDNADDIITSLKANGVDAGTEALVGTELSTLGIALDANNIDGVCTALEEAKEGLWKRTTEFVKRIFAAIRDFFARLFTNTNHLYKLLVRHEQRIRNINNPDWKSKDKEFKVVDGSAMTSKYTAGKSAITAILNAFKNDDFELAKTGSLDDFVKGDMAEELRIASKKTITIDCEKDDAQNSFDATEIVVKAVAYNVREMQAHAKYIKALKIKKVDETSKNEYKAVKCARAVAQFTAIAGTAQLRIMRGALRVYRNIK